MEAKGYRQNVGVRLNDGIQFEIIGKRFRGSFRKALRDYGMEKKDIDRVILDLDCDREVAIQTGRHTHYFRAL